VVEGLGQEAKIKNLKVLPLDDCDSLKKSLILESPEIFVHKKFLRGNGNRCLIFEE
jgi:hypothetical protein